jgi:MSHA pilin protein MshA
MLDQIRPDKAQQQASEELTMVKRHERKRGQAGFTLIEIIAVLVILGILAVVAVPKYLDMQKQAAVNAVQGGIAAMISQVSMDYAAAIMASPSLASTWTGVSGTGEDATNSGSLRTIGDFVGSYSVAGGKATVFITGGATSAGSNVYSLANVAAGTDADKGMSQSFQLYK